MPVRIYEISKKLGIENKQVLAKARELGITTARVASSSLDKITAEYLEEQLGGPKPPEPVAAPVPTPEPDPDPIIIISKPEEVPAAPEPTAAETPPAASDVAPEKVDGAATPPPA